MIYRSEIWFADLEPIRGHEQGGRRPVLVVSHNLFNNGPADLVIVLPITSRQRNLRTRVELRPPEGGLMTPSYVICESVRSISKERLSRRIGTISPASMAEIEDRMRILLGL